MKVIPFPSLSRQRNDLLTTNHHLSDEPNTTKKVNRQNKVTSSVVSPSEADGIPSIDILGKEIKDNIREDKRCEVGEISNNPDESKETSDLSTTAQNSEHQQCENDQYQRVSCDVKSLLTKGNSLATKVENGGTEYVTQIILREDDSFLVHLIGEEKAISYFQFLSTYPSVRAAFLLSSFFGVSIAILALVVEEIPPTLSYPAFFLILPGVLNKFTYKSWDMFKLILFRLDFIFDFLFTLFLLIALFVQLGDARIFGFTIIILSFLDERTVDSRVIFIDQSHFRASFNERMHYWESKTLKCSRVLLMFGVFTLSSVIAAGLIVHGNPNAVFQIRPVDNSSTLIPPSGTFAILQLNQFASNGLSFLLFIEAIHVVGSAISNQSQRKAKTTELKWVRAPIKKKFVDFGEETDRTSRQYGGFIGSDVVNSSIFARISARFVKNET